MKMNFFELLIFVSMYGAIQACVNRLDGKVVRVAGDFTLPAFDALEPNFVMNFDTVNCQYTFSLGGLKPDTTYKWKIVLDGSWSQNYGCNGANGPDCSFKSDSAGSVRFLVKSSFNPPQLSVDFNYAQLDFTVPFVCNNKFLGKDVRASGNFSGLIEWSATEPLGLMSFDPIECMYSVVLTGIRQNYNFEWKVLIGNSWNENYGCNGLKGPNCVARTSSDGAVRLIFKQEFTPPKLSSDYNLVLPTVDPNAETTTRLSTIPIPTTQAVLFNPVKPCLSTQNCPACTNNFKNKLLRVSGDWSIDAGSATIWSALEPLGLLTFEEKICSYTVVITGLKPSFSYKWKLVVNNLWSENYGCTGLAASDCTAKTNNQGAIRFIVKPTNPPQLTSDYNVYECGDGICQEGETCKYCPEDCGGCPPPVCGDGVCEEPEENYLTCPADCSNELPGCDRFNDEGCRSGSQFHANEGVEKRRWQTPKPGSRGYQASYQDYHSLVGYADIRYTSPARTEADVCITALHKNAGSVTLTYYFNDQPQADKCKRFTSAHKTSVALKVTGSDNTQLVIHPIELYWNAARLADRPGDYRNGQKGAVAEMFGWPHKDVEKECDILAKAGYLGVKLFPVHEQLMSTQPFNNVLNPWYFMYQPVSYKLDGRMGTREELQSLINTCRSKGLRVYVDAVLNHFVGAGNDLLDHRNPSAGCAKWGNKTSSAPLDRQSPFYSHAYTYKYNQNTGEPPSNEFPGAAIGPEDFHCDRVLGSWSDLFILNNGWLVGLTDLDTSKENVRDRQAAYLVEMISMGVSGFRFDAAKHMSPEDLSAIFKKVQTKMGGQLADDFFAWLEVITGGEAGILWFGAGHYGPAFESILKKDLGSQSEVDKIKMWDGLYPKEPQNNPISKTRVVIQNDDHDQQNPGSSSRDMGPFGCVLVKNCPENDHRNFEVRLFTNPNGVGNNDNDWPIRFILSSYYFTHGSDGIPDGLSDCKLCTVTCDSCRESVPYLPAYEPGVCGYKGNGYTRAHRDIRIINAMRSWIKLGPISGGDIGLPGC